MQGKIVLITGGAKRVGAAICRRLHAAGANLMLHYRASAGEARLLQAELNHVRADSVALIQADLLEIHKLPAIVEQTVQRFGRLDALVNNASSFYSTPVGSITAEAWEDLIGTNLRAPLFLAQAAGPALRKSQGAIVNIADIHADRPLKNFVVYSVAKAGLVGLTRSLARELAPEVRVNAIAPGPILWPDDAASDDMVGTQESAVCVKCHKAEDDNKGFMVAGEMKKLIDSLKVEDTETKSILDEAVQKGMDVSDAAFSLKDVRQVLIQSRTTVHTFDLDKFKENINEGFTIVNKAKISGEEAIDEFYYRRIGLGISTILVTLLVIGLYIKLKKVEKKS